MSLIDASEESTPSTAPMETLVVRRRQRLRDQVGEHALVRFGGPPGAGSATARKKRGDQRHDVMDRMRNETTPSESLPDADIERQPDRCRSGARAERRRRRGSGRSTYSSAAPDPPPCRAAALKFGKLEAKALPASKNGTTPIVSVTLTRNSADASNRLRPPTIGAPPGGRPEAVVGDSRAPSRRRRRRSASWRGFRRAPGRPWRRPRPGRRGRSASRGRCE